MSQETQLEPSKEEKKPWLTWEHTLEIVKILATVWVALIGTICTMQFQ